MSELNVNSLVSSEDAKHYNYSSRKEEEQKNKEKDKKSKYSKNVITRVYKFLIEKNGKKYYEYRDETISCKVTTNETTNKEIVRNALSQSNSDVFNSVRSEFGFKAAKSIEYLSYRLNKQEIDNYLVDKQKREKEEKLDSLRVMVNKFIKQDYTMFSKLSIEGDKTMQQKRKVYMYQNTAFDFTDEKILFENAVQNTGWYFPSEEHKNMLKFNNERDVYFYMLNRIIGYEDEMYNEDFTFQEYVNSFVCGYYESYSEMPLWIKNKAFYSKEGYLPHPADRGKLLPKEERIRQSAKYVKTTNKIN